jgi:hypothetical protein
LAPDREKVAKSSIDGFRLELLGAQLEKLKSTLHCLMSVLIHARMLKTEYVRVYSVLACLLTYDSSAPLEGKIKLAQAIREKNETAIEYEELKRNHDALLKHMVSASIRDINSVALRYS